MNFLALLTELAFAWRRRGGGSSLELANEGGELITNENGDTIVVSI